MQTDRVSWNMKPGRSNLSENTQGKKKKERNFERACVRVSKMGRKRRRRRSTKKVGD